LTFEGVLFIVLSVAIIKVTNCC